MAKKLINGKKYGVVPNTDLGTNVIQPGGGGSDSYIEAPANPSDGDTLVYNSELQTWEAKAPTGGSNVVEAVWGEPEYDDALGEGVVPLFIEPPAGIVNFVIKFPDEAHELRESWAYLSEYSLNGGYYAPLIYYPDNYVEMYGIDLFEYNDYFNKLTMIWSIHTIIS